MNGLLVDFGGVLTTNVFASFTIFCSDEGIDPDRIFLLGAERGGRARGVRVRR
jgi:hypothetical protein